MTEQLSIFFRGRTFFGHVVFWDERRRYKLSVPEHVWREMGQPIELSLQVGH